MRSSPPRRHSRPRPRRRDHVAMPHNDFVDDSLGPVVGRKLALLDGALDENVFALFKRHSDFGKIAVERQIVPIRALLPLAVAVLKPIGLAQSHVRHGHPGWEEPNFWFLGDVPCYFHTIHLHTKLSSFRETVFLYEAPIHG